MIMNPSCIEYSFWNIWNHGIIRMVSRRYVLCHPPSVRAWSMTHFDQEVTVSRSIRAKVRKLERSALKLDCFDADIPALNLAPFASPQSVRDSHWASPIVKAGTSSRQCLPITIQKLPASRKHKWWFQLFFKSFNEIFAIFADQCLLQKAIKGRVCNNNVYNLFCASRTCKLRAGAKCYSKRSSEKSFPKIFKNNGKLCFCKHLLHLDCKAIAQSNLCHEACEASHPSNPEAWNCYLPIKFILLQELQNLQPQLIYSCTSLEYLVLWQYVTPGLMSLQNT